MTKKKKGRMKYLPKIVIEEMQQIKVKDNLFTDAEAFRRMSWYSKKARKIPKKGFYMKWD